MSQWQHLEQDAMTDITGSNVPENCNFHCFVLIPTYLGSIHSPFESLYNSPLRACVFLLEVRSASLQSDQCKDWQFHRGDLRSIRSWWCSASGCLWSDHCWPKTSQLLEILLESSDLPSLEETGPLWAEEDKKRALVSLNDAWKQSIAIIWQRLPKCFFFFSRENFFYSSFVPKNLCVISDKEPLNEL